MARIVKFCSLSAIEDRSYFSRDVAERFHKALHIPTYKRADRTFNKFIKTAFKFKNLFL